MVPGTYLADARVRWVQTDMGNASAVKQGLEKAPIKVSDAVEGILVEVFLSMSVV